jgi:hypothetical protein
LLVLRKVDEFLVIINFVGETGYGRLTW